MQNSHHPLTLFILKKFYSYQGHCPISNGLKKSALFVVEMLLHQGIRAKLVEAIDGNSIDRIVTEEKPASVVLEAIWVTPKKLAELQRLHPQIQWTVRVHSELPFLANEGMAIEWIRGYLALGVQVGFNSARTVDDFSILGDAVYLPNYYPLRKPRPGKPWGGTFDVGCFGAIRPLKNQLIQAFAAIRFAEEKGVALTFHMNGTRLEQSGANNLKNIEALFRGTKHSLVLHPWMDHEEFLELVAQMDICLQVSLSESFNIVSADAASMGVPLVGSDAIIWLPRRAKAEVDSSHSIVQAMRRANEVTVHMNHAALEDYLETAVAAWMEWV